jgi:hypothetical protein
MLGKRLMSAGVFFWGKVEYPQAGRRTGSPGEAVVQTAGKHLYYQSLKAGSPSPPNIGFVSGSHTPVARRRALTLSLSMIVPGWIIFISIAIN